METVEINEVIEPEALPEPKKFERKMKPSPSVGESIETDAYWS